MSDIRNQLFRLKKYLEYQYKAMTKYYIHSPFVYQFYLNVLEGKDDEKLRSIEPIREYDTKKYQRLLYRLIRYYHPQHIVELGPSSSLHPEDIARAYPGARLTAAVALSSMDIKSADLFFLNI